MPRKKLARTPALPARERILQAATHEFVTKGYDGARVDAIVAASGVSKNLVYHYFDSKEDLFIAVLERTYERFRARHQDLRIRSLAPIEALRQLTLSTFDSFVEMPEVISLLNTENLYKGVHVRKSRQIRSLYNPLLETIECTLEHGEKSGVFRNGINPVDLYISISGLAYHYVSNTYTLSAIFGAINTPARRSTHRQHVVDMVLRYCLVDPDRASRSPSGRRKGFRALKGELGRLHDAGISRTTADIA